MVFISYTHDSDEHQARALHLAQRLRRDGLDCRIDLFVDGSPRGGWPLWMERQIEEAHFVLVVCSETYMRRYSGNEAPRKGLGATWEGLLTRQDLYEGQGTNDKFIPVHFDESSARHIPKALRGHTRYLLEEAYERLYRHLTSQPAIVAAPLGTKRFLPPGPQ